MIATVTGSVTVARKIEVKAKLVDRISACKSSLNAIHLFAELEIT